MKYYQSQDRQLIAVDCIIFGFDAGTLKVLLLKRNFEPEKGKWSLAGGFLKKEESLDECASRVLHELTGLRNVYLEQLASYAAIDRDPGERVISVAYFALLNIQDHNIDISRESAIFLYCAIASNTLNFNAKVTTQRDRDIYDWLGSQTDIPTNLVERMFKFKSIFDDESFKQTIIGDFKEIKLGNKLLGLGQLEVVGLDDILKLRKQQILDLLNDLQKDKGTTFIFLSAVDLVSAKNIFITNHEPTKDLLESVLGISFNGNDMAEKSGVILRKELIPEFRKAVS
jgi:ADP-ribose pyrophosphatase YjhB (NUDIX family)